MTTLTTHLTIPFAATPLFNPGTLEVVPHHEDGLDQPAELGLFPVDGQKFMIAILACAQPGVVHYRVRYDGPGTLSYVAEPNARNESEPYYLRDNPFDPDQKPPIMAFEDKGARTSMERLRITFNGETERLCPGFGTPEVSYASTFYDSQGQAVPAPEFRAYPRGYYSAVPVFGDLLIEVEDRYRLLQVRYLVPDGAIPKGGYSSRRFQVRAPGRVVYSMLQRRAVDYSVRYTEKKKKVEVERHGVVDRIFPSPPEAIEPPPPDPVTGRDDYTDIERITKIVYTVARLDRDGKPIVHRDGNGFLAQGSERVEERYNSIPPPNSYVLTTFSRPS